MSTAADSAAERFSALLLRHRGRTGLTQRELAVRVGASRRVVQDWEAGVNIPGADRLQALIAVLFDAGGLRAGSEADEVHALWAAALAESSRMRTPLDESWLTGVLAQPAPENRLAEPAWPPAKVGGVARRQDWGEAPDMIGFVGRGTANAEPSSGCWLS
ncbi:MAG TPA: helix-turn-helix transcriptional regulator [Chloroflexota bacterium]